MTVGALSLMRGGGRPPFDAEDLTWAQDLGHRIGLAIENARLYEEARELFGQTISANFVSTPDGRILACNQTFASLLGFDSVEAVMATAGRRPSTRGPEDRERLPRRAPRAQAADAVTSTPSGAATAARSPCRRTPSAPSTSAASW